MSGPFKSVRNAPCRFESSEHDDGDPFDGAGGTLAHAYLPQQGSISGNVHFDDAESWTVGNVGDLGIDLLQVAVHEIGHSLGLDHSQDPEAIMFPSYSSYKAGLDLAEDDIKAIQALYGAPRAKRNPPKIKPFISPFECPCKCLIM